MKNLSFTLVTIILLSALICCSRLVTGTSPDKKSNEEIRIAELEEVVKRQAEELKKLKTNPTEEGEVVRALRVGKRSCTKIEINEDTARIYFCNILEAALFLEHSESRAYSDLNLFTEKAGLEEATIEYFVSSGAKIFSISGSPFSAETKSFN
jgi:hypothetical protein